MTFAERHRPTTLNEIVGQPTDEIAQLIDGKNTPNLLLYGPPGTGKTTTARAIAHEMHGSLNNLHEINASDDRGIGTIRDQITKVAHLDTGTQVTLSMNIPIVLLDECDSMTTDAQQALRSPMEDSAAVFVLTANDVDQLHDALRSRCHAGGYHFDYPSVSSIVRRLQVVAEREGMDISEDRLIDHAQKASGDIRTALDLLEQDKRFNRRVNGEPEEEKGVADLLD